MVSLRTYLLVAGGLMVVAGYLGLAVEVGAADNGGRDLCGTGFIQERWTDKCDAAVSARRMWVWPVLGVGSLVAMVSFVERDKRKTGGETTRTA